MISKKDLNKYNNFVFISTLKKIVGINIEDFISLEELINIERQKKAIYRNSISFLTEKKESNNILLWGSKGMGKSSLILSNNEFINKNNDKKLKLLEIFSTDIKYLPEIIFNLKKIDEKFIIYIDDITMNKDNDDFKIFKISVQGSLLSYNKNIRFYVTSNIRNIVQLTTNDDPNDLNTKDQRNNAIALYDRFGIILSFHQASKENYLYFINFYAKKYKVKNNQKELEKLAMQWSIEKGDFSARTAKQFIINFLTDLV